MSSLTEKDLIQKILAGFVKSELHENNFFESDAEVFNYKNNRLLFTTDDFSSEDLFREIHPRNLGRNLAIASLSDILACGGNPLFYAHSMAVSKNWEADFITKLSEGISEILQTTQTHFLGGDFGISEHWHYTGIVIGEVIKPLSRIGARPGDSIFLTGKAGTGNLEAALSLYSDKALVGSFLSTYKSRFHLRLEESALIRHYASSCIDTSDGVINGIKTIAQLNHIGFSLENIPLLPEAVLATKLLGKPAELLLFGECGEYELLFTVPAEKVFDFEKEAKAKNFEISKIGVIQDESTKVLKCGKRELVLDTFDLSARAFDTTKEYLSALTNFITGA